MKGTLDLVQEQKLQQKLSAQQVQYVRLLEMTAPEIEDEVRRVVDDNPALIAEDDSPEEMPDNSYDNSDAEGEGFSETAEQLQRADYSDPDDVPYYRTNISNASPDDPNPREFPIADSGTNLYDSLMAQIAETDLDEADRMIAAYIIGNIDDSGYLRRSPADIAYDIAMTTGLDVDTSHVRRVMDTVRSLDPAGICATDLRDCLMLQLGRRLAANPRDEVTADALKVIDRYFDLFSDKKFDKIRNQLNISSDRLHDVISLIRTLNPKPGTSVVESGAEDKIGHITPDFSVEPDRLDPDRLTVTLLNRLPQLTIERSFMPDAAALKSANARAREAQAFIRKKYDDARGFISSLKRRSETLFSVMQAIVEMQPQFFRTFDRTTLRPMVLKDLAAKTGLDISVISRATAGKYVHTPAGVFPLKMFFSEASTDNPETSIHKILDALKQLIDNEDHSHPLSDDRLCALMNEQGYDIARRTVSKYRERLKIPVARLRRQI